MDHQEVRGIQKKKDRGIRYWPYKDRGIRYWPKKGRGIRYSNPVFELLEVRGIDQNQMFFTGAS